MSDTNETKPLIKKAADPITTTAGATVITMGFINMLVPAEEVKSWQFLAPFVGFVVATAVQYLSAYFITYSPDEIRVRKKLERDKESLIDQIDDVNAYPDRYPDEHLDNLKSALAQTNLKLSNFRSDDFGVK